MFKFASERQFVFNVNIGGRMRLVEFGSRDARGVSIFMTNDRDVADAVRRQRAFMCGAIKEIIEDAAVAEAVEAGDAGKAANTEEKVMTFANITQAKAWLVKTFDVQKAALKKPEAVDAIAKEHGVRIEYVKE